MSKHLEIRYTILQTIYWFDLFDKALTFDEICHYLLGRASNKKEVLRTLRKMIGKELGRKGDVYYLNGRVELIDIRKKRLKFSKEKFRKVKKYLRILKMLPFVRAVAVTQNLAIDNAKETSDIDLLIISEKNRIYTARFFVNVFLDTFRLRDPKNKNRVCPNFFISENNLDISSVSLKDDIYLAFWVKTMVPFYNAYIIKNFKKRNIWLRSYFPNKSDNTSKIYWNSPVSFLFKKIIELCIFPFANFLEKKLKEKQLEIIEANRKKAKNLSIVANDKMVKVHYDDRRLFYNNEWQKRLSRLT